LDNTLLKIEGLSKKFGENTVLKDINMDIKKGEIIGLVGENGAGKSTLMKIIFGMPVINETGGYGGKMIFDGEEVDFKSPFDALESGIGMVHQEFSLIPGFKASENIVLNRETLKGNALEIFFGERMKEIDGAQMKKRAAAAIKTLGVDMNSDTLIKEMPVAHKQFTEIARELEREKTKLLVLDEPTAVLTEEEAEVLLKSMRNLADSGISIIFITHRLNEIIDVADRVVVLRDGVMIKETETATTSAHEITEWMIGRSLKKSDVVEEKIENQENVALELKNLWVDMPGELVKDVNLSVYQGEILGIGGMAGQGKLGIANGIMGIHSSGGEVHYKGKKVELNNTSKALQSGMFLVSEDRKGVGLLLEMSIEDNIAYPAIEIKRDFIKKKLGGLVEWVDRKSIQKNAEKYIEELEIRCMSHDQSVGKLSGGNQQKVCMAKAFTMQPELLMVSEPTRGIDVGAKKLVLDALREYNKVTGATIVITSSELEELRSISDRIAIINEGRVAGILPPTEDVVKFGELMVGVAGEESNG